MYGTQTEFVHGSTPDLDHLRVTLQAMRFIKNPLVSESSTPDFASKRSGGPGPSSKVHASQEDASDELALEKVSRDLTNQSDCLHLFFSFLVWRE